MGIVRFVMGVFSIKVRVWAKIRDGGGVSNVYYTLCDAARAKNKGQRVAHNPLPFFHCAIGE